MTNIYVPITDSQRGMEYTMPHECDARRRQEGGRGTVANILTDKVHLFMHIPLGLPSSASQDAGLFTNSLTPINDAWTQHDILNGQNTRFCECHNYAYTDSLCKNYECIHIARPRRELTTPPSRRFGDFMRLNTNSQILHALLCTSLGKLYIPTWLWCIYQDVSTYEHFVTHSLN